MHACRSQVAVSAGTRRNVSSDLKNKDFAQVKDGAEEEKSSPRMVEEHQANDFEVNTARYGALQVNEAMQGL